MTSQKIAKVAQPTPPSSPTVSAGVESYGRSSGHVMNDPLKKLDGRQGRKIYSEMEDNDSTVGAVMFGLEMWLRSVPWTIVPSRAIDNDSTRGVEFLKGVFRDMPLTWDHFMSEVATVPVYGWSWHDMRLKRRLGQTNDIFTTSTEDDGMYGISDLSFRSQLTLDSWDIDNETGHWNGWFQSPPVGGACHYLPRSRGLHMIGRSRRGSPEGKSWLRNAYVSYYYLKLIQSIEAVAIERELSGFPVIKIPGSILVDAANPDSENHEAAVSLKRLYTEMAENIKSNDQAGAVLPSDPHRGGAENNASSLPQYNIELLSSNGQRAINTAQAKERYQMDMARTMLFDHIFLGQGDKGSNALASNKIDMSKVGAAGGLVRMVANAINTQLIPYLWMNNGFSFDTMPTLKPGTIEKPTLEALGGYFERLTRAGVTGIVEDESIRNELLNAAQLPTNDAVREMSIDSAGVSY